MTGSAQNMASARQRMQPVRSGELDPREQALQGRTEHMSVKGLYGIGMRWLARTPSPSPACGRGETRTMRQGVPMRQKLGSLIFSVRP